MQWTKQETVVMPDIEIIVGKPLVYGYHMYRFCMLPVSSFIVIRIDFESRCVCFLSCACTSFLLQWETREISSVANVSALWNAPVILDNHVYQFCELSGAEDRAALFRIKIGAVDRIAGAWQPVGLPDGDWCSKSPHLFSYSGRLHCILHPLSLTGFAHIFSFDQSEHWQLVTCMPVKLYSFGICVVDSTLYVIGGRNTPDEESPMLSTVHTCDLSTEEPEWDSVPVPDLPYGCTEPWVAILGSHIHVLGYYADETENKKKVISMDMSEPVCDRHWSGDVLPRTPNKLCASVVMNDHLVLLGGTDDAGDGCSSVYLYIPECHQYLELPCYGNIGWTICPPCLVYNNSLYIPGPFDGTLEYLSN